VSQWNTTSARIPVMPAARDLSRCAAHGADRDADDLTRGT
jgi:hypothetical protein